MMKSEPRRVLQQLIERYGVELAQDPRRTEALLNDLCGEYRREIFVLVNAQRQNVPAELLAAPAWMPHAAVWSRLSRRLQDKLALAADAADWAVETWAEALSLTQPPARPRPFSLSAKQQPRQSVSAGRQSDPSGVESGTALTNAPSATSNAASNATAYTSPNSQATDIADAAVTRGHKHAGGIDPRTRAYLWVAGVGAGVLLLWLATGGVAALGEPMRLLADPQNWLMAVRTTPAEQVQRVYSLPRMAWVGEGPLIVRSGPSLDDDPMIMLETDEVVRVTAFSSDAEWSQISQPVAGWVNNDYLNFLEPDNASVTVRVGLEAMTALTSPTPVLVAPDMVSAVAGSLEIGAEVITVAATVDGQWRRVDRPLAGWVASADLQAAQSNP